MPGREMNQFDSQRLKEKKIERDIGRNRLGTRQDCCRDCRCLSSITVLVDVPLKRTALHFPNWFSFEMTNGSTRPINNKQFPRVCTFRVQKLLSQ